AEEYIDGHTLAPRKKQLQPYLTGLFAGSVGQAAWPQTLLPVAPALGVAGPGEAPPCNLAVLGLLAPQESLSVTGRSRPVRLLLGKTERDEGKIKPPPFPGGPPPLPTPGEVRYARL